MLKISIEIPSISTQKYPLDKITDINKLLIELMRVLDAKTLWLPIKYFHFFNV